MDMEYDNVVYKYILPQGGSITLKKPFNKFLKVGEQGENLVLWVEESLKEKESVQVQFFVLGTGWRYPDGFKYIDSVQMSDGLVWHVFYKIP